MLIYIYKYETGLLNNATFYVCHAKSHKLYSTLPVIGVLSEYKLYSTLPVIGVLSEYKLYATLPVIGVNLIRV